MIVKNVDDGKIEVLFTLEEVAKIRNLFYCDIIEKGLLLEEEGLELMMEYIQSDDWMNIDFAKWCDIINMLYYRESFSIDEARTLNIILRDGVKLTHTYFTSDEWMILSGLSIVYEDGVKSTIEEYFRDRKGEAFKTGYSLKEQPDNKFCRELLKRLYYQYGEFEKKDKVDFVDRYYQYFESLKFAF